MTRTLYEGAHSAEFIAWEADTNFTRANLLVPSTADIAVGVPLLKVVAGGAIQPIVAANYAHLAATLDEDDDPVAPLATFAGFLIDEVIEDADAVPVERAVLLNGPAILRDDRIAWPHGADDGATATIKAAIKVAAAGANPATQIKFQ